MPQYRIADPDREDVDKVRKCLRSLLEQGYNVCYFDDFILTDRVVGNGNTCENVIVNEYGQKVLIKNVDHIDRGVQE